MKKVLISLLILALLLVAGGAVYALFFMEEDAPKQAETPPPAEQTIIHHKDQPQIDTRKKGDTPADLQTSLDYEIRQNRDTVGWLLVPGTQINDSVLQSHDNAYYLRRDERRNNAIYGCYFADYECSIGERNELSPNTIIYGHSDLKDNPDGLRFSQLFRFTDEEFAKEHPVIQFAVPGSVMNWEIFSVCYTDLEFDFVHPKPKAGIDKIAQQGMEKSIYDYGVTVTPDDHILTLSTCTVKYGANDTNHRFLVMAKLLPEDADVPTKANITPKTPKE